MTRRFVARAAIIFAVGILAIPLTACSQTQGHAAPVAIKPSNPVAAPPDTTPATPTPAATPAPQAVTYPTTTQVIHYADSNGNKQTITMSLGAVIPGNDQGALASAWAKVGGSGDWPCQDVRPDSTGLGTNYVLASDTAGYAFGTLAVTNDTPSFPVDGANYQFTSQEFSGISMGLGFSNGAVCSDMSSGGYMFQPSWQGAAWGPVPILVAVPNYISPNHPTGDPALLQQPITLFSGPGNASSPLSMALKPYAG